MVKEMLMNMRQEAEDCWSKNGSEVMRGKEKGLRIALDLVYPNWRDERGKTI